MQLSSFLNLFLRSSSSPGISSSKNVLSSQTISGSVKLAKSVLDRSESSLSNNSDDKIRQYWGHQLPDDITPDFNVIMEQDDQLRINNFSFASLSLQDNQGAPQFPAFTSNRFTTENQLKLPYGEDMLSSKSKQLSNKPWNDTTRKKDQLITPESPDHGFLANIQAEQRVMENPTPFKLLAMQFPEFSEESLADVYFANGGDLNLIVDMLTQLELQVDGGSLNMRKYIPERTSNKALIILICQQESIIFFRTAQALPCQQQNLKVFRLLKLILFLVQIKARIHPDKLLYG